MNPSRWTTTGLGDAIVNDTEAQIVRHVGVKGSKVKPGWTYQDGTGAKINITGFSSTDGGYLGVDEHGVFRVYDHTGYCIELSGGRSNLDRTVKTKKGEVQIKHIAERDLKLQ